LPLRKLKIAWGIEEERAMMPTKTKTKIIPNAQSIQLLMWNSLELTDEVEVWEPQPIIGWKIDEDGEVFPIGVEAERDDFAYLLPDGSVLKPDDFNCKSLDDFKRTLQERANHRRVEQMKKEEAR